jgi:hypothetical protein
MKKTILLLSIIFISCENEIVQEMQNFNGVWELKSSRKATLLENAGITSIDFGNGFFSRKSSRSENVGKVAFMLNATNDKKFQAAYRVTEPTKLKFQFIEDYRVIQEGTTLSRHQPTQLSKELESSYAGEWSYRFDDKELILIQESDTLRFQKP